MQLLWLCGPSGVGKSTVGWEIFRQLTDAGSAAAYVDADQLALCYPAPPGDPYQHRLKARNLAAIWPRMGEAGTVILSGGIESADQIGLYTSRLPHASVTMCRLRASHATLTRRFLGRGWMPHLVAEAVAEADELDRLDFAGLCLDTDGLTVAEAGRLVRDRAGGWPTPLPQGKSLPRDKPFPRPMASPRDKPIPLPAAFSRPAAVPEIAALPPAEGGPVPVLWLCGARAVGKSTVGYQVFSRLRAEFKAAYVDLAQIGFAHPAPAGDPHHHRLKAANLAAMWLAFRDAGARCLVVTGHVHDEASLRVYAKALPGVNLTVRRLEAGPAELTDRVLRRGRGDGPAIPGDELKGLPPADLRLAAARAGQEAEHLRGARVGEPAIGTDGKSVDEVVQLITESIAGWAT